jgi:phosphatidylethanolamine-binding protein (PEBP) family uncharacterized protein
MTGAFGGACPPPGEVHRCPFTVHALGPTLEIDNSVSNALAGFMVNANSLEHGPEKCVRFSDKTMLKIREITRFR